MKNSVIPRLLAAAAALTFAAGTLAQSTTVDLKQIRKSLGELQASINDTVGSLTQVREAAKAGSDIGSKYAAFNTEYKELESLVEKVRAQGTRVRARAEEHYRAWREELSKMSNPKLREKAQNRFADAKEEFDEIIVIADEAKRELEPFMADLRDVAIYLKSDLSADAVKSLSNTIWKLGNKSKAVIGSIQHVNTQINKTLEELPEGK